jgi:hypothetical protein
MPREVLSKVVIKAKKAVFAGNVKPAPWVVDLPITLEGKTLYGALDIALSFYGASYTQRDIESLRGAVKSIREAVKYVASVPAVEILKLI